MTTSVRRMLPAAVLACSIINLPAFAVPVEGDAGSSCKEIFGKVGTDAVTYVMGVGFEERDLLLTRLSPASYTDNKLFFGATDVAIFEGLTFKQFKIPAKEPTTFCIVETSIKGSAASLQMQWEQSTTKLPDLTALGEGE